ncbi:3-deoxy-D-manno-oct-2-ulosonate III transferase WaaZ [Halomonas binhaiensis]|uniref:3-deoxy-D-manno-oct-2-ulosonate III transferase WaaZ n=1 Tax=Halomonas binhaiensis TaxID=2562282 RepID=A0A5C1NHA0_9GAMM|nr:3-deoxy-D-manno-oct-2-ulosonate III transferase WaaZ [Halomonas binhaiensis]QEM82033.1 3-deoxy-D-manno-oct-2-ulosonate III transferase WaaZ [Halomonas binhaiensis]
MSHSTFGLQQSISHLSEARRTDSVIIFLSGPSSSDTPLSSLSEYDTICVNGSAEYLIVRGVKPFIYLVTDHNYFKRNSQAFFRQASQCHHTVISKELFDVAIQTHRDAIRQLSPTVIHRACKSKKGGIKNFIRLKFKYWNRREITYTAPLRKSGIIYGYSRDIRFGYFHARTVAYAATQLAESLSYSRVYFSGFDMTGASGRFYDSKGAPQEKTTLDEDYDTILNALRCMKENSRIETYNLSRNTRIPYHLIPFAESVE